MDTLQHEMQGQTNKNGLLPKYFIFICWEWKGILYKDFFSENQIILSNLTHPKSWQNKPRTQCYIRPSKHSGASAGRPER